MYISRDKLSLNKDKESVNFLIISEKNNSRMAMNKFHFVS